MGSHKPRNASSSSEAGRDKGTDSPLGLQKELALLNLSGAQQDSSLDFGLQNHKRINFCCINIKPPSLRSGITAALGNKDGMAIKMQIVVV